MYILNVKRCASCLNHMPVLAPSTMSIYSASAVDRETDFCLADQIHHTLSSPCFGSHNAPVSTCVNCRNWFWSMSNQTVRSRTRLGAFMCTSFGSWLKVARRLTAKAMSSRTVIQRAQFSNVFINKFHLFNIHKYTCIKCNLQPYRRIRVRIRVRLRLQYD
ncbi:uncharacterized protein YALI1_A18489g [Yarrowia lipolytica]|uniref:Uncharacterized protein n=1 Tax=Yarrowia lipolytica TaxID=4952 RepID=A0A1D8N5A0_YARLL|nr:hypothetical protein YALI1_A18489g [Yarrowia lipolytica]